jgi:hypothetical protein
MAELWELVCGSEVTCQDEPVGSLKRLIVDRKAHVVTHLAVEAGGLHPAARLVPVDLVRSAAGGLQLRCSKDEYYALPVEAHIELTPGRARRMPTLRAEVVHLVPDGTVALEANADVIASNSHVGDFIGLTLNATTHLPEHVLVRAGRLRNKRQISVPFEYVTYFDQDGRILLSASKEQLSELQS